MKHTRTLILGALLGIAPLWGCATVPADISEAVSSLPQEAARTAMDYRKLATELREMARRREIEADILAKQQNPDETRIRLKREMAQELSKEADLAEQRAREMQRSVPHGMMQ